MLSDEADFWPNLHEQNKGVFYRASCKRPLRKLGSKMGAGKYVTWRKGMAEAFGKIMCGDQAVIEEYVLPPDLKLLDSKSRTMTKIKANMGVNPWDNFDDQVLANILAHDIKKLGYDGAISDDAADGIVVFEETKIKKRRIQYY